MKQQNRCKRISIILLLVLLVPLMTAYGETGKNRDRENKEPEVPPAGLRAEEEGRWEKAIEVYRTVLSREPRRSDLWIRIANIQALLEKKEIMLETLKQAALSNPNDKEIFVNLSQANAELNRSKEALEAIERAVHLDPVNIEYLKARAQLANWQGVPKIAANSYRRLIKLLPDNDELLLELARACTWDGQLDRAAASYKKYLSSKWRPGNLDVMIEYIKVQTWRGNFAAALKLLEQYREKGGDESIYLMRKADILCRGSRPRAGLKALAPLLFFDPADYELHTSRTLALHYDHRPGEAVDSLEILDRLRPQSYENQYLRNFVWTELRHSFPVGAQYYNDSIGISIFSAYLDGGIRLNSNLRLQGGYTRDFLKAPVGSGFNNINGEESALHFKQWGGANLRLNRFLAVDGCLGTEKAEELPSTLTYGINTHLQVSDTFQINAGINHDYFLISPRAVSLGIRKTTNQIDLQWKPGLRYVFTFYGGYDTFTDDNTRWQVIVSPRYVSTRASRLNLDIGFKAWWFGFKQGGNGYWAPRSFESYMGVTYGYWKLSENDGISFQGEAGVLRANNWNRYRVGYSVEAHGLFGIYRDLLLQLRAAYLHNAYRVDGSYDGVYSAYLFSASMMIRL
jgi:tetratricopeptide (TPR) repeat protein